MSSKHWDDFEKRIEEIKFFSKKLGNKTFCVRDSYTFLEFVIK